MAIECPTFLGAVKHAYIAVTVHGPGHPVGVHGVLIASAVEHDCRLGRDTPRSQPFGHLGRGRELPLLLMPQEVLPKPAHSTGDVPLAVFVDIRLVLELDDTNLLVVKALCQPLAGNEW